MNFTKLIIIVKILLYKSVTVFAFPMRRNAAQTIPVSDTSNTSNSTNNENQPNNAQTSNPNNEQAATPELTTPQTTQTPIHPEPLLQQTTHLETGILNEEETKQAEELVLENLDQTQFFESLNNIDQRVEQINLNPNADIFDVNEEEEVSAFADNAYTGVYQPTYNQMSSEELQSVQLHLDDLLGGVKEVLTAGQEVINDQHNEIRNLAENARNVANDLANAAQNAGNQLEQHVTSSS